MNDTSWYPSYRAPWRFRLGALGLTLPGGVPLLAKILADGSVPWAARLALALPTIATILVVNGFGWRTLTSARPSHLVTRRLLRARVTPWPQIRAIGKDNYGLPVADLVDGQRIRLPNVLDDAHSTGEEKLEELRRIWQQQRERT
ncbi:hypothetical protein GCM10009678_93580 [Actinomadura kijaniata]|uniref:Low molecular weight protein antigen 6 PH domain-containing protein n=1 Tax=Actinomadura namibiensis TaxID=182080 RepID=A0A7W3QS57_ACTNM|nr:PH domain-containing protein [Actinomadura namibiensis]MBA8957490.1 hypothetical protein [Actinomadura namibiensis]